MFTNNINWMDQKKYHVITYGCQMNKNDSERISGMMENLGFQEADDWRDANLVILNTCSIRDKSERRVVGKFHELNFYRKRNSRNMKLAITGCMPQHKHSKKYLVQQLPFLDYIVGVNNMEMLPTFMEKDTHLQKQVTLLRPGRRNPQDIVSFEQEMSTQKRKPGKRAWVSIMFGCDKFCTYCIVPFTRGREVSRSQTDIFKEIELLQDQGIESVVLLGQNVNSYGIDRQDGYDFSDLIEDIALQFPWIHQIDFLTSHPRDVNKKLIDVIAKYESIGKDIHFPLQHGDDTILEKMNRGYTVKEYRNKVEYIRSIIPNARIGTDLIVGFPGEGEKEYQQLLQVCKEIKFDYANTAAFSPRPGTLAAKMPAQVDPVEKKKRLDILNKMMLFQRETAGSAGS